MKIKKVITVICLLILNSNVLFGVEETDVSIQKVEGRTEAVVSSAPPPEAKVRQGWFKQVLLLPEKTIVGTARVSSQVVGKITDATVLGVQTTGGFLFSPFFRAIDAKKWKKESDVKSVDPSGTNQA